MNETQRLELIANLVSNAKQLKIAPEFQGLFEELKAEKLAEDLVLEHGTQHASKEDIEDEFVSLDSVDSEREDDDFDNDENLVDMNTISGAMAEAFNPNK